MLAELPVGGGNITFRSNIRSGHASGFIEARRWPVFPSGAPVNHHAGRSLAGPRSAGLCAMEAAWLAQEAENAAAVAAA